MGNICAVKDISRPQEEERNVETCLLKELSCFLQDVNKRLPSPAQEEIIFPLKVLRMELSLCCFPDDAEKKSD
jgi:hypothetical protein